MQLHVLVQKDLGKFSSNVKPLSFEILILKIWLGLVRDLNPGPLAPKARIIPLDQRASLDVITAHPLVCYHLECPVSNRLNETMTT